METIKKKRRRISTITRSSLEKSLRAMTTTRMRMRMRRNMRKKRKTWTTNKNATKREEKMMKIKKRYRGI